MLECPFFVLHYKKNLERKAYLKRALARHIAPIFIEDMDQGEFPLDQAYRFDPALFTQQIMSVKDCMIAGTLKQGRFRDWPSAECVRVVRDLNLTTEQTLRDHPWLGPQPLTPGEISLVLKHRIAWERIVARNGGRNYRRNRARASRYLVQGEERSMLRPHWADRAPP